MSEEQVEGFTCVAAVISGVMLIVGYLMNGLDGVIDVALFLGLVFFVMAALVMEGD